MSDASFLFAFDMLFFPALVFVDLRVYRKQYMARFVDDESKNKRGGKGMDVSGWPRFNYGNVPRQHNGLDCGEPALTLAVVPSRAQPFWAPCLAKTTTTSEIL